MKGIKSVYLHDSPFRIRYNKSLNVHNGKLERKQKKRIKILT